MSSDPKKVIVDGLWANNPAFAQLLGLCPLLAVTSTVVNALALGIATLTTLALSNLLVSLLRNFLRDEIRIPAFVLIIASIVTVIELTMNAFFYDLYIVLGIFIPLIVTNCVIIGRAEAFASKNSPQMALLDGAMMGLGFTFALVVLGAMREVLGMGTLFSQAHLMFGDIGKQFTIVIFDDYKGYLLALLPPGAFIGLGFLVALKNVIDAKRESVEPVAVPTIAEPATS